MICGCIDTGECRFPIDAAKTDDTALANEYLDCLLYLQEHSEMPINLKRFIKRYLRNVENR